MHFTISLNILSAAILTEFLQIVLGQAHITTGPGVLTTSYGSPVRTSDTRSLNSNLIRNPYFMESMGRLVRERIPERIVHALGSGAFGYFEVTNDITHLCKADFLSTIGKRTPVAVRFSLITADKGSNELSRSPKGFAVKFYTQEGNYDLVGLSSPVFPIKDPVVFPTLTHASRRHPISNLPDVNTLWDFLTLRPEAFYNFLITFGDPGISDGYRRMPGYGIHTFQVVNQAGGINFLRFHLIPDAGVRNLLPEEAENASVDPDYSTRDLYVNIANGNYPSWTLSVQVITLEEARSNASYIFDVTRELPITSYPLIQVGRLVLNQNPNNYFAQIEQLAFRPGNLVPGIIGAPDKLFEARSLTYRDAEIYRLGVNFNNIPVNCPISGQSVNYLRDGRAPVNDNGGNRVNYYPNTFNGPLPYIDDNIRLIQITESESTNNFDQARDLYVRMSDAERTRVVDNIMTTLGQAIASLQCRAINLFNLVHPDLATRVSLRLQRN